MAGKRVAQKPCRITPNKIDIFLASIFVLTVAFIVAMIVLFAMYQCVPDSLIAGFFGFVGGECGIMGWIKTAKERKRERRYEIEDRKYNDKIKEEAKTDEDIDTAG